MKKTDLREKLLSTLPPIFSRQTASKAIGGLLAPRTLANLDSLGQGPERVQLGRRVGYERDNFVAWLLERTNPR